MGKRSDFERIERYFYPTPAKAVLPLLKYLHRGVNTFAERCCGDGDLICHLESHGFTCVSRGDIATGQDALKITTADLNGADTNITNPPYRHPEDKPKTRRLLHDLITHFLSLGLPSWMLIDHDWMTNLHAVPFLPRCSDIVIVGRVTRIAGTKDGGKANFSWFRFAANHPAPVPSTTIAVMCAACGGANEA